MNILSIDTANRDKAIIGLKIDNKQHTLTSKRKSNSQKVIPLIVKILKKHKLELEDIDKIEVNAGPGSFTGIRVGVSIANALGSVLNIPVNSGQIGELVEAKYK